MSWTLKNYFFFNQQNKFYIPAMVVWICYSKNSHFVAGLQIDLKAATLQLYSKLKQNYKIL